MSIPSKTNPMESTTASDQIHLPPLGDRLKSDVLLYNTFINDSDLKKVYQQEFLDNFFSFLSKADERGQRTEEDELSDLNYASAHEKYLTDPSEIRAHAQYHLRGDIFEAFLEIYGSSILSEHKTDYERYQQIAFKSASDHIRKTQQEITQLLDPQHSLTKYNQYVKKLGLSPQDELERLGHMMGLDIPLGKSTLTIRAIQDLIDNSDFNEQDIQEIRSTHIIPHLLSNPMIMQDVIAKVDKDELIQQDIDIGEYTVTDTIEDLLRYPENNDEVEDSQEILTSSEQLIEYRNEQKSKWEKKDLLLYYYSQETHKQHLVNIIEQIEQLIQVLQELHIQIDTIQAAPEISEELAEIEYIIIQSIKSLNHTTQDLIQHIEAFIKEYLDDGDEQ